MWVRCLCALAVALVVSALEVSAADPPPATKDVKGPPSNLEPDNGLRLHGRGLSKAEAEKKSLDVLLSDCLALDKQAGESLDKLEALRENKTLDKVNSTVVASTWIRIDQLKRNGMRLRQLGEPAGIDIDFRQSRLFGRMAVLLEHYRNLKSVAENIKKALPQFKAEGLKLQPQLKEALALLGASKASQAEQKFYEAWDRMNTYAVFYRDKEYFETMKPFTDAKVEIEKAANVTWRAQAESALADARDKERPEYEAIQKSLAEAASQLQKSPQAKVGESMLTGPEAVKAFGDDWKKLHLAAYRSRALEWARGAVSGRVDDTRLTRLVDDDAKFTLEVIKGLSGLVAADALRASEAEAPLLYALYLKELAPLEALQTDGRFLEAMNAGLEPLRNKSQAFSAEVTAYNSATSELLWWRRQSAKAVFKTLQANFPVAQDRLMPALITKGDFDRGLIATATRERGLPEAELRCTAKEVILHAWPMVQDQRCHLVNSCPILSRASSRYGARHYGTMDTSRVPPGRADRLKEDLLITKDAPPLTLEAASAAYTAENGYYNAVGGEASAFYLDSLIVTFATLKSGHMAMTTLGPLVNETFAGDILPQMVVRCDLRPTWVYHEYFVSDVPPAPK